MGFSGDLREWGRDVRSLLFVSPAGSDEEHGDGLTPEELVCKPGIYFPCK